jgi:phytoene synthase
MNASMPATAVSTSLEAAYQECRAIAKREAKNFYYAFRVLPRHKMDAMCAVYAFMRKADDISDDESQTIEVRRDRMNSWLNEWRAARTGAEPEDPVFHALNDAQAKFGISDALLEDLVRGTCMDLYLGEGAGNTVDLGDGLQGYETFGDLYRYCYLVASVVGLVCIHIFGYSDPAAELMAEKTGAAFQITNILRDIKEDAERKRIYLPQDMLHEFAITNADILELAGGRALKPNERAMLMALSVQAWEYYESGRQLIALIDADSRACLWVMIEIYSGLLAKIDQRQGDVFSERVSLPTGQKIFALIRGAAMSLRQRSK